MVISAKEYAQKIQELGLPSDFNHGGYCFREAIVDAVVRTPLRCEVTTFWLPTLEAPISMEGRPIGNLVDVFTNEKYLCFNIGDMDDPYNRAKPPLILDLTSSTPYRFIAGAAKRGKTMMIKSVIIEAMRTTKADELNFFIIDGVGTSLADAASWCNVSGYANMYKKEHVKRMLSELIKVIQLRQRNMQQMGEYSIANYLRKKPANDPYGYIIFAIDDFDIFSDSKSDDPDIKAFNQAIGLRLVEVFKQGAAVGIRFLLTMTSKEGVHFNFKPFMNAANVMSLRVSNEKDSVLDPTALHIMKAVRTLPVKYPGRGIYITANMSATHQRIFYPFRAVLPVPIPPIYRETREVEQVAGASEAMLKKAQERVRIEADPTEDYSAHINEFAETLAEHQTAYASPIPVVPDIIPFSDFCASYLEPLRDSNTGKFPLRYRRGAPVGLSIEHIDVVALAPTPTSLVYGGVKSGKTTMLSTIMRSKAYMFTPEEVVFLVVDPKRGMFTVVEELTNKGYIVQHLTSPTAPAVIDGEEMEETYADLCFGEVFDIIASRRPAVEDEHQIMTEFQRTGEYWWDGPQFVVIMDDFHLIHRKRGDDATVNKVFSEQIPKILQTYQDCGLEIHTSAIDISYTELSMLSTIGQLSAGATVSYLSSSSSMPPLIKAVYESRPAVRPPGEVMLADFSAGANLHLARIAI